MYSLSLYFRYTRHLTAARRSGIRKGTVFGCIMGFIRLVIFLIYAVGFIYGTRLIYEEHSNIGDIFVVIDLSSSLFKLESAISVRFSLWFSSRSFLLGRQRIRCDIKVVSYRNINIFLKYFCCLSVEAICAVDSIWRLLDIVRETYMFATIHTVLLMGYSLFFEGYTHRTRTTSGAQQQIEYIWQHRVWKC